MKVRGGKRNIEFFSLIHSQYNMNVNLFFKIYLFAALVTIGY